MLQQIESFLKETGLISCYCPLEASNEVKQYRKQFDTMNYYENSKTFSKEELSALKVPLSTLEEVVKHKIDSSFMKTDNESYLFDKIVKIVPEPNENEPKRVRADVNLIVDSDSSHKNVIYEVYFIKPIEENWICFFGDVIKK
eukprot:gene3630-6446_t